ncbi:MAG: tRNA (adenosine(37)-N6)-threonylcarbamoyltransferase complex ATPase subunit type 1 TsaE [Desulfatitalea sp.]|nr:tRNA (adenosine(37)-N6)-threonylcarbamoyltransferase complex ATPase subunit type 1 TsaE [Desulfatitalea sp.]MBI5897216.1 tRNA (adenosine(37)-N6)-threonylcarbamoyltransferase complex ATPase subunit type 1 TsaE [Desulfobacterales bacterium]
MPSMFSITTHSPEQTRLLGYCLGNCIRKGIALRLHGDLGSGKTCFVQGLAQGLEVPDGYVIASPTYALINEYQGRLPLYHVDLYRLEGGLDADRIGLGEILGYEAVVAVEWAERLPANEWPEENLTIDFATTDDQRRSIRLIGYGRSMDNLIMETGKIWDDVVTADKVLKPITKK